MIQQVNELFLISNKICDIYSSSIQKILKYLKKNSILNSLIPIIFLKISKIFEIIFCDNN